MIIFCYGQGGHSVQANKLLKLIKEEYDGHILHMTDAAISFSDGDIKLKEAFPKDKRINLMNFLFNFWIFYELIKLRVRGCKLMISFGPGLCIIPGVFWWMSGGKLIYFETWSRFETASKTAKILSKIARITFVQNRSLARIIKNSIYRGRL